MRSPLKTDLKVSAIRCQVSDKTTAPLPVT
jgi:hypothetical protein